MKTETPTPAITRRLRVSFDVELRLLSIHPDLLEMAPNLVRFQKALDRSPELRDRLTVLQALDCLSDQMAWINEGYKSTGWLPSSPFDVIQPVVKQMTLAEVTPFLVNALLQMSESPYAKPLFPFSLTSVGATWPVVTDLESGQALDYKERLAPAILYNDPKNRCLVVEIADGCILALNLISFEDAQDTLDHLEAIAADVSDLGLTIQSVQAIVLADDPGLSPEELDDISVRCAEAFPGLPVNVYVFPGQGSGDASCAS